MSNPRASSGVRNLRAMFEGANEATSPPSRGRSPTGSETTTNLNGTPRPLSKVRTSFVAVERSGEMGPQLGLKKLSDDKAGAASADGKDLEVMDANKKVDGGMNEDVNVNRSLAEGATGESLSINANKEGSNNEQDVANDPFVDTNPSEKSASNTEHKPASSQTEDTAPLPEGNPESHEMSGVLVADDGPGDLGSILKGSAFEPLPTEKKAPQANSNEKSATMKPPPKPKAAKSVPYGKAADIKHPSQTGAASKGAAASKTAETKDKAAKARPGPISTSKEAASSKPSSKAPTAAKKPTSPVTPQQPKTPLTPKRQPNSKNASPRQTTTAITKEPNKAPLKKTSRASLAPATTTTANTAKPRAPRQSISSNKAPSTTSTTNKTSPFTKPRPKSPTRPAHLPAAATAPTAASAAKLGGTGPARPPSRASNTATLTRKPSTLKRDTNHTSASRVGGSTNTTTSTDTSTTVKKKLSRPSLSMQNQNGQERPKSRMSIAGGKAPDEGFLARMMRPTASSASKTHERVEVKTPPRKVAGATKAKRSPGAERKARDATDEPEQEAPQQQPEDPADASASASASAVAAQTGDEPEGAVA